jgi:hypothetical protein
MDPPVGPNPLDFRTPLQSRPVPHRHVLRVDELLDLALFVAVPMGDDMAPSSSVVRKPRWLRVVWRLWH